MRVRFNPAIGVLLVVLGVPLLLGLVGLGVFYLVRPYFWVRDSTIALGGRTFEFDALRIDRGRVYAITGNRRTKLPIRRWAARRDDWRTTIEG